MNEPVYGLDDQIPFNELPKVLWHVYRVRISLQTLYRWRRSGRNGVLLPVNLVLGKPHITLRQIDEFNQLLTAAHRAPQQRPSTDRHARYAHERAKRMLAESRAKRAKKSN